MCLLGFNVTEDQNQHCDKQKISGFYKKEWVEKLSRLTNPLSKHIACAEPRPIRSGVLLRLPTILSALQRYELFINKLIGKSLFLKIWSLI